MMERNEINGMEVGEYEGFDKKPSDVNKLPTQFVENIRRASDDFLLKAVDYPSSMVGLSPEESDDRRRYRFIVEEARKRGIIK